MATCPDCGADIPEGRKPHDVWDCRRWLQDEVRRLRGILASQPGGYELYNRQTQQLAALQAEIAQLRSRYGQVYAAWLADATFVKMVYDQAARLAQENVRLRRALAAVQCGVQGQGQEPGPGSAGACSCDYNPWNHEVDHGTATGHAPDCPVETCPLERGGRP